MSEKWYEREADDLDQVLFGIILGGFLVLLVVLGALFA